MWVLVGQSKYLRAIAAAEYIQVLKYSLVLALVEIVLNLAMEGGGGGVCNVRVQRLAIRSAREQGNYM